jgi:glutamate dehydrogenase
VQIDALQVIWSLQRSMTRWLLARPGAIPDIATAVERYHDGYRDIRAGEAILPDSQRPAYEASLSEWRAKGMPEELALQLGALPYLEPCADIIEVARGVLRDELAAQQRALVGQVLSTPGSGPDAKVANWIGRDDAALRFTLSMLGELATQRTLDYPTTSVAVRRLAQLAAAGG